MSKENSAKKAEAVMNTRAVFDAPVQRQQFPIYKVVSHGVCIEFTDKLMNASKVYKEAPKPKSMWKIANRHGTSVEKIYEEVI